MHYNNFKQDHNSYKIMKTNVKLQDGAENYLKWLPSMLNFFYQGC
jgi:hypothetical protein